MRPAVRSLQFALLCGVVGLAGCASVIDGRIEQLILAELPRVVGPAARYDVDVAGTRVDGDIARLRQVRVSGERVERARAPVLDRAELTMSDVVVNRTEKRLLSARGADANVRILPRDIAVFLDAKAGLTNAAVTLHPPYEMTVEVQFNVAGFVLPPIVRARVRGRLVASAGNLVMEVSDLRLVGVPTGTVPAFVLERLINPLVDLSGSPAPSRVNSVSVTPDAVTFTASSSQVEAGLPAR
ncbi:MAG: LmeA family phospholipid-binding protein [Proteobacteria bacterium]|nr:LmeA family phospholipid-binding protein [Burkholderiales bacterium]